MYEAAAGGHVHVLEWAHNHGCPKGEATSCNSVWYAARWGQLEAVKWLVDHGYDWSTACSPAAAGAGHVEVLRWAAARGLTGRA